MAWLIVLGVVVAVLVFYFSWLAEKKRREAMATLAAELGWRFEPGHDRNHDDEYAHFEIFRRGHSRVAYNTLWGELGIDDRRYATKTGDFRYKITTHSGKSSSTTTYRFSYLILHLPFTTPALLVRPEGIFDKVAGAFGFEDIDFESAEFSRKFYVSSSDKRFAYDVIHPRMMELLLSNRPPMIDIEAGQCCLAGGSRRWEPAEFRAKIGFLRAFFALWPEHVTVDLERRSG